MADLNEQVRAEFEAWWRTNMNTLEMDLHRFGDGYACHETNRGWMTWQAARRQHGSAAQAVADKIAREYIERFKSDLYKVPYFADRVNKATRDALTAAHMNLLSLPAALDAALSRLNGEKK